VPAGAGNFSLHHSVQNGSEAHPASYATGTRGSFPEIKRPGHEADHSPPSGARAKSAWSYNSTPPIRFHGVGSLKAEGATLSLLYPLCCFSVSEYFCCLFRYRLSSETFGYTLTHLFIFSNIRTHSYMFLIRLWEKGYFVSQQSYCLDQWYSTFFPPRTPRDNFPLNFVPPKLLVHNSSYT
jgi:hypothetical protein